MKKIAVRTILIILIVTVFITIFCFSNQNGTKSKGISRKVAEVIININEDTKKLNEKEKQELIEEYQPLIRKGAHFSIYTLLGLVTMVFMYTFDIENKKRIVFTLILGIIYASTDEIHQIFIPERAGKITDVLIDAFGVIIGILIILGISKIIKRGMEKGKNIGDK